MKHTIQLILTLIMLSLSACTTNNGDIGVYYGTWALDSVTIDGTTDTAWCANGQWTTWSFQNNIVCIMQSFGYQEIGNHWGTWSEESGKLLLDYRHHDDTNDDSSSIYEAPTWIYMEPHTVTTLNIEKQTSKAMTLSFVDSQGRTIRYELRKTH